MRNIKYRDTVNGIIFLILVFFLFFSGHDYSFSQESIKRDITAGLKVLPENIDPANISPRIPLFIYNHIFDTLVRYKDSTTDVEPSLATSWHVSRDGLNWTFRLRQGVRFHDGSLLTADDVVNSFKRQMFKEQRDPKEEFRVYEIIFRGFPGIIKNLVSVDRFTVKFELNQPFGILLSTLAHPFASIIKISEKNSDIFMGTGPFTINEFVAQKKLTLNRNKDYWGKVAIPTSLTLININLADALSELRDKRLDLFIDQGLMLSNNDLKSLEIMKIPGFQSFFLVMNSQKEPFAKKKIRQAITNSLRPDFLSPMLGTSVLEANGFFPHGFWAGTEWVNPFKQDITVAKKLLSESGFPAGMKVRLLYESDFNPGNSPDLHEIAGAIRENLKLSGIEVALHGVEKNSFEKAILEGDYEMCLLGVTPEIGEPGVFIRNRFHSEANSDGKVLNVSFYKNPHLDSLIGRAEQLSFRPERMRLYKQVQNILFDETIWIPLYHLAHQVISGDKIEGLKLNPSGAHRLVEIKIPGNPTIN